MLCDQNNYLENLIEFYKRCDLPSVSDMEFALEYARIWWSKEDFFGHRKIIKHSVNDGLIQYITSHEFHNIALIQPSDPFSYYVKRSLLLADSVLLYDLNDTAPGYLIDSHTDPFPPNVSAQTSIDYEAYLRVSDAEQLGQFLRNNKKMLLSRYATYYPDIKVDIHTDTYWSGSEYSTENPSLDAFHKLMEQKGNVSSSISRRLVDDRYLRAIAEIEIPYIDDQDDDTMLKIIEENSETLSILRKNLKHRFFDLYNTNGSETFDQSIHKIGMEIRDGVDEISSEMKKLKRHTTLQAGSGLLVGTIVATLAAINGTVFSQNTINQLLTYFGAGGGVISMAKFLDEYLNQKQVISEKPYYFIWLFHKK